MNRTAQFLLVSCFMLLLIGGCSKPYKKPDPVPTTVVNPGSGPGTFPVAPGPSLNELFKEFRTTPEVQCVTAGIPQTVTFAKGTRLTFYPNSFKDAAGAIITSGTVCIEMVEMYKPGDMIANRATTTTKDGELLRSGGQVYINATKDGQTVYANKYGIAFRQPAPSEQPMDLYYGDRDNEDSVTQWTISSTINPGTSVPGTRTDSLVSSFYFDSTTRFRFINCDMLYTISGPRTNNIRIFMPDTSFNKNNTNVLFVFPTINSVVRSSQYEPRIFTCHGSYTLPVGLDVSIIVLTKKNDDYYYYEQTGLSITDGMTINATITKQSLDFIKSKLNAL